MTNPNKEESEAPRSFADFLRNAPPDAYFDVTDVGFDPPTTSAPMSLQKPVVEFYCDECDGIRFYDCTNSTVYPSYDKWVQGFMTYMCRNCKKRSKLIAVGVTVKKEGLGSQNGRAFKYGEVPTFGDPTPSKVLSIIGPDRELFLRGPQM